MDISKVGEFKTGRLVPIPSLRRDDWAFVPNDLPPSWSMRAELWPLVAEARNKVGELNGVARTLDQPLLLLRPMQQREALRSSSLEGTYVKPQELLLFEVSIKDEAGNSPRTDDWREVFNYYKALIHGTRQINSGARLDRVLILQLHKILLSGVRGENKRPGEFRDCQAYVGSTRGYNPPPPDQLSDCLANLETYLDTDEQLDPLIRAFVAHYQFEAIHPFRDGNGRIGRVLLSLAVYKWQNLHWPCLYLSEFFERNKTEYIDKLFQVSANAEWDEWLQFCLRGVIEQSEESIVRCTALRKLRRQYLDQFGHQSTRASLIIKELFKYVLIRIVNVQKLCKVSYPTAKADILKLVDAGVLLQLPDVYPKTYFAPRIMEIAYAD